MNTGRKYYFLTIAETLNITRAAERLMVSQPSLTQYLNRLESELDIKLIARNFTPLRLTKAGMLYRDYLIKEKALETEFTEELNVLKNENRLPLRIGIPLQKRYEKLSSTLLEFCMDRPSLDVRVWEGTSATIREKIQTGELDVGFGHLAEETAEELTAKTIRRERILIICNRCNPIVPKEYADNGSSWRILPENLNDQLFYQMSPEYYLCTLELSHMAAHGVKPKHRIVMSNLSEIIKLILDNPQSGFAYMPDYVLEEPGTSEVKDRLALLRLDDEDYRWSYTMFRKKGRTQSKDAKDFWNLVVKNCCE